MAVQFILNNQYLMYWKYIWKITLFLLSALLVADFYINFTIISHNINMPTDYFIYSKTNSDKSTGQCFYSKSSYFGFKKKNYWPQNCYCLRGGFQLQQTYLFMINSRSLRILLGGITLLWISIHFFIIIDELSSKYNPLCCKSIRLLTKTNNIPPLLYTFLTSIKVLPCKIFQYAFNFQQQCISQGFYFFYQSFLVYQIIFLITLLIVFTVSIILIIKSSFHYLSFKNECCTYAMIIFLFFQILISLCFFRYAPTQVIIVTTLQIILCFFSIFHIPQQQPYPNLNRVHDVTMIQIRNNIE